MASTLLAAELTQPPPGLRCTPAYSRDCPKGIVVPRIGRLRDVVDEIQDARGQAVDSEDVRGDS